MFRLTVRNVGRSCQTLVTHVCPKMARPCSGHGRQTESACNPVPPVSESLNRQRPVPLQRKISTPAPFPKRAGLGSCSGKVNNSTRRRVRPFGFEPEVPPVAAILSSAANPATIAPESHNGPTCRKPCAFWCVLTACWRSSANWRASGSAGTPGRRFGVPPRCFPCPTSGNRQ